MEINLAGIFTPIVNKVIVALLVLLLSFIFGKIIGKIVHRILQEIEFNKIINFASGLRLNLDDFIGRVLSMIIYFIGIMWALTILGFEKFVANLLIISVFVVIIASLLLTIRDFIPNMMAGFKLYRKNSIQEGAKITYDGITGTVLEHTLTNTRIKTAQKDILYIPNSLLLSKGFKKHGR